MKLFTIAGDYGALRGDCLAGAPTRIGQMIAGILETPRGPFVVRLVGPEQTVVERADEFITWLKRFR
jgi:hypothetical protein